MTAAVGRRTFPARRCATSFAGRGRPPPINALTPKFVRRTMLRCIRQRLNRGPAHQGGEPELIHCWCDQLQSASAEHGAGEVGKLLDGLNSRRCSYTKVSVPLNQQGLVISSHRARANTALATLSWTSRAPARGGLALLSMLMLTGRPPASRPLAVDDFETARGRLCQERSTRG
jgi:hypothetical protein